MRVAFFQRLFAHYQWGLMQELSERADHQYVFFGDTRDPLQTGIAPIPSDKRKLVDYRVVRTWQPAIHLAFQPAAMWTGFTGRYDAFIFEGAFQHPTAWIAMLTAQARGKRVLLYTHGWRRKDTNALIYTIRLAFLRKADGLLLYGSRAKSIGLSLGIAPDKMYVVLNSLDHRKMVSLRNMVSQDQHLILREQLFGNRLIPVVIYSGRLMESKRVDLLIEACARVIHRGYSLGLLVVGGGPEMDRLKDKAKRSGVPAHFTGPLYDEAELCRLISASNVMVVPGPVGLSAIHAMTYGTPIITNDSWDSQNPEAEAIVPGRTGAFFRQDNPNTLADVLISFTANPNTREHYASHCIEMVDKYYNPSFMRGVFDRAVSGIPPDDTFLPETGEGTWLV